MMRSLSDFLNGGIQNIAETAGRFYLDSRRGQVFMLRMMPALRKSAGIRKRHEKAGTPVPPFLIASIASSCNLRCAGCYARANGGCGGGEGDAGEMSAAEWRRVFTEASDCGVSFILLAGGEPLLRRDVLEEAARFDNMIFPVFTNGTMLDAGYLSLFDEHRGLIPVLSIEGDAAKTDARRGEGVFQTVRSAAEALRERGLLYGVSITVTSENKDEVTDGGFVSALRDNGCGLAVYVEYVPAQADTDHLILSESELKTLQERIGGLRGKKENRGMILLSFPGDEAAMGGCLAAGRGFFHINAGGGAEPCPFSPYAEMNLKRQSILDVLRSPFFEKVRGIGAAEAIGHAGGCTLFPLADEVAAAAVGTETAG